MVTLPNGEVAAFMGHPDEHDVRHRNALPERYNQAANTWLLAPKDMSTSGPPGTGGRRFLFFPHVYVLPNGNLFFATPMPANFTAASEGPHFSAAYNAFTGDYLDPKIDEPDSSYADWDRPSVLLPLLPSDDYRVRILFAGGLTPQRLDLGAAMPAWASTAGRAASISGRNRRFSNAVLLPTGEVCVVGGVHVTQRAPTFGSRRSHAGSASAELDEQSWTALRAPVVDLIERARGRWPRRRHGR